MVRTSATDEGEQKVLDDIAKHGWHCLNILEEKGEPPWAFSIGLFHTWQHPELIIIGLKRNVAHEILNIVATGLAADRRIDLSQPTDDLLKTGSCMFVEVPKKKYRDRVGFAQWYYEGNGFPLYQIVWPSSEGYFPWNHKASDDLRSWQPVLGHEPKGI